MNWDICSVILSQLYLDYWADSHRICEYFLESIVWMSCSLQLVYKIGTNYLRENCFCVGFKFYGNDFFQFDCDVFI